MEELATSFARGRKEAGLRASIYFSRPSYAGAAPTEATPPRRRKANWRALLQAAVPGLPVDQSPLRAPAMEGMKRIQTATS